MAHQQGQAGLRSGGLATAAISPCPDLEAFAATKVWLHNEYCQLAAARGSMPAAKWQAWKRELQARAHQLASDVTVWMHLNA